MAIKTFLVRGSWAPLPGARTRTERIVAADSQAAAARLLGVSAHTLRTYGMPGSPDDRAAALARPGQALQRPVSSGDKPPWRPVDEPYPLDDIPERVRAVAPPSTGTPAAIAEIARKVEALAGSIARGEADDLADAIDQMVKLAAGLQAMHLAAAGR